MLEIRTNFVEVFIMQGLAAWHDPNAFSHFVGVKRLGRLEPLASALRGCGGWRGGRLISGNGLGTDGS